MRAATQLDVLIVEDHRDTAESLRVLLELSGHRAYVAHNAQEALQVLEDLRPNVVFIDLGLPDMSGRDLALRLRAHPACSGSTVTALSGYIEDDMVGPGSGFDSHLEKPVDPDDVLELLAGVAKSG